MYFGFDVFIFDDELYMLGETLYLCFYVYCSYLCSCLTLWYIGFDLYYEVIHGICLFILCFVKTRSLFWFTYIFHTCVYVLFNVSGIYRLIQSWLLSTFANNR